MKRSPFMSIAADRNGVSIEDFYLWHTAESFMKLQAAIADAPPPPRPDGWAIGWAAGVYMRDALE